MKIKISSNAQEVAKLLREVIPQIHNQEKNRALESYAKDFARHMVREVFNVKGRHRVARSTTKGGPPAPGNQPTAKVQIAKKMRVAGFRATLSGRQKPTLKRLEFATKNPILLARETGAVARPETSGLGRRKNQSTDDGFLYVRVKRKGRRRKAKKPYGPRRQRADRYQERNDKLLNAGFEPRKVQSVRIRAVLGLRRRWRAYRSRGQKWFDLMVKRTARRARSASVKIAKAASGGGTRAAA